MALTVVGPDGWLRRYLVRAPADWYYDVVANGPIPMVFFLSGGLTVEAFADFVKIETMFRGYDSDPSVPGFPTDLTLPTVEKPKFVAVFVDQTNPMLDRDPGNVQPGPSGSFNSGATGVSEAEVWDPDDIGAIEQIGLLVKEEYDFTLARLLGGVATAVAIDGARIFACGFSDGGFMCVRLLHESGPGGRLETTLPFRGVFVCGATAGQQVLHDRPPLEAQRFAFDGITAVNTGLPGTVGKALFIVMGQADPRHDLGLDQAFDPADLVLDDEQVQTNPQLSWNYPYYDVGPVYPVQQEWTVISRSAYAALPSGNAWADLLGGVPGLFGLPTTTGLANLGAGSVQYQRTGVSPAPWSVRVWDVEGLGHAWPNAPFEGVVVAWRFFQAAAP